MNYAAVWNSGKAVADRGQRQFMDAIAVLVAVATVIMLYEHKIFVAITVLGIGLLFWWAFVVGRALLLQRDLRLLHVPDADRTIVLYIALQFVLLVLVPAAAVAAYVGLSFAAVCALLTCFAAGGILWQVLPRWCSIFIAFVPSVLQLQVFRGQLPGLSDPAFANFGWPLAVALAGIAVWRWRVLLKADEDEFGPWSMPMVIQMRRQVGFGGGFKNVDINALTAAAKNTGLNAQVQLAGVGPATPVRTLRVWFGAVFAPLSARARFSQSLYLFLPLLLGAVFMGINQIDWKFAASWGAMMLGIFIPVLGAGMMPARISRLYRDAGGELALLATLPGLGNGPAAKRNLLLASAGTVSFATCGLGFFAGVVALVFGANSATLLTIALPVAGSVALNFALALNFIGGRALSNVTILLICVLGLAAVCMTPNLISLHRHPEIPVLQGIALAVTIIWSLFYTLLAWLGLRGWRAYERRPHPFLLHS